LYSVQFIQNLLANRNLQKAGLTKASIDFRLFTTHTAIHLGIKRKVQVWISSLVDVPSVTGFIKPIILLPAALVNQLSVRQVEAILIHELAHIKRNDYIINLDFLSLNWSYSSIRLFFLLGRIARRERENCCDDWVITYRYNQYDYAQTLLFLEEQRQLQPAFALAATNCKKNLLNRIKRLFHSVPQTNFSTRHQIKLISLCIVLLVAIVITPGYLKTQFYRQTTNEPTKPR
jgi:beta-lactamase regulating signal transducer with metallopeptidase domain